MFLRLIETNPKAVREGLMQQCAQILACYRKNCASPSSAGETDAYFSLVSYSLLSVARRMEI